MNFEILPYLTLGLILPIADVLTASGNEVVNFEIYVFKFASF